MASSTFLPVTRQVLSKIDKWRVRPAPHPSTVKVFDLPEPAHFINPMIHDGKWPSLYLDYASLERRLMLAVGVPKPSSTINLPEIHLPKANLVMPGGPIAMPRKKSLLLARWQWHKSVRQLCADAERLDDFYMRRAEEAMLAGSNSALHTMMMKFGDRERELRGKGMALDPRIRPAAPSSLHWTVPSSTGVGSYKVDMQFQTCDCPDYAKRRLKCKHIYAVEVIQAAERATGLWVQAHDTIWSSIYSRAMRAPVGSLTVQRTGKSVTGRISSSKPNLSVRPRSK
jgi:hypothetical protein